MTGRSGRPALNPHRPADAGPRQAKAGGGGARESDLLDLLVQLLSRLEARDQSVSAPHETSATAPYDRASTQPKPNTKSQ
jgi:hypothetical protein